MRAHPGDQLVVESPATGTSRHDGRIVGLPHEDGRPPHGGHPGHRPCAAAGCQAA
ncbi:DUF1918 domain-containing protein [Streptomyces sp. NPDC058316]|uniref:DUF1918 domain-containing protein n=1 Tax=unclassified Streptomyces TaxID=2593676 RepID=UPI0036EF61ED